MFENYNQTDREIDYDAILDNSTEYQELVVYANEVNEQEQLVREIKRVVDDAYDELADLIDAHLRRWGGLPPKLNNAYKAFEDASIHFSVILAQQQEELSKVAIQAERERDALENELIGRAGDNV